MHLKSKIPFAALLMFTPLASSACVGSAIEPEEEEELGTVQQAKTTSNALTPSSLTSNGLTANGLTANGLTANGLTSTALSANSVALTALTDPAAREFFKYVVSCANVSGNDVTATIGSTTYTWYGELGLAPNWGTSGGSCDSTCKQWVSSCVLSRVNYLGQSVTISVRGHSNLVPSSSELTAVPYAEAAYYGDITGANQLRFACWVDKDLMERVCGPQPFNNCVMDVVGQCDHVCQTVDSTYGFFQTCSDGHGHDYPYAITVFRDQN